MKTIKEEFPPEEAFAFVPELADAYTRLRARAVEMERALMAIEERYTDGEDTFDDWRFMGETARRALPARP